MQSKIEKNRINDVIDTTFKSLNELIDINTIIGKPITTSEGTIIIPISKVTVGVLSGGGEYGKINIVKNGSDLPYSAGNGAIVSIKPYGFLINENSNYKLISVSESPSEKLIEKAMDFIDRLNKNYE